MNCPRCHRELKPVVLGNVQVDTCDSCEGIWFDGDELVKVVDGMGEDLKNSLVSKSWEGENTEIIEKLGENDLSCPRCGQKLRKIKYCYSSEVIVDSCEKCGIWLDDTEIRKVFEFLTAPELKMTLELSKEIRKSYKEDELDPKQKKKIIMTLKNIEQDARVQEEKLIDSMVITDDKSGILKPLGEVLQFVYRIFYRLGL